MKKQLINLQPVKERIREKLLEKYDSTLYMNTNTIKVELDIKDILEEYITEQQVSEPEIYITPDAYIKMRKLVDDNTTEIGWYGTVTQMPGLNSYVIDDILVYPQTVTSTTCEQDNERIFEFEMSLTTEQVNHKRFQGHSHVNMGVTPSGVDEQFYQDLLSQVQDYFIICVTNKRNEYTVRFYDIANNILYTDIKIQVLLENGTDVEGWFEDTKEQLKTRVLHNTYSVGSASYLSNSSKKQKSIWDEEEDNEHEWDPYFGYVSKAEKRELYRANADVLKHSSKRGRPRKGK